MNQELQSGRSESRLVLACWLAWLLAGTLPALYFFRFLYADGAYFFLRILEGRSVFFPAEGRAATYVLTQWPAPVAIAAGCADIRGLAWLFGAGLMLTPALFHGVSLGLLLRKGLRLQAMVYLVLVFLLMGFSGLCIVTDSHTPAALFLLALVWTVSFEPERIRSWVPLVALGALSLFLYEFWAFYAAGLLMVLVWRIWPRWPGLPRRARFAAVAALAMFAASAGIQAWRLAHSSDNPNQASLLQMLHGTTYPAYLALIAAWFAGVCGHTWLEEKFGSSPMPRMLLSARARRWILGAAFVLLAGLCAIQHATMIRYSYPFRTLNLILPLVYAGWLMLVSGSGKPTRIPAGGRGMLVALTVWLVANEAWMTLGWREYQSWAGDVRRTDPASIHVAQPPATRMAQTWIFPWSHSPQSFLSQALRYRRVDGVAYDPGAKWRPYGPGHEEELRQIAGEYGVQWEPDDRE